MKPFSITINWDRIRQGPFPEEELKEIDDNTTITIEKITPFKEEVTIKLLIEDNENELNVAYQLGALIHSYEVIRRS